MFPLEECEEKSTSDSAGVYLPVVLALAETCYHLLPPPAHWGTLDFHICFMSRGISTHPINYPT